MRQVVFFSWLFLLVFSTCAQKPYTTEPKKVNIPSCEEDNYILIFEDNFDGDSLDMNNWMLIPWAQGHGVGSSSLEINTLEQDNLEVSDGSLKIKLNNEPKVRKVINHQREDDTLSDGLPNLREFKYSGSNIWTKSADFHYGKYEIRAKIGGLKGIWASFWTYSGDGGTPGGTHWNELDIFEVYYRRNWLSKWTYTTNVHYDYDNDGSTKGNQKSSATKRRDLDEWHTYTCVFDSSKIEIYIDDKLVEEKYRFYDEKKREVECGDNSNDNYSELLGWPRDPGHLILSMGMKASQEPKASKFFPVEFEIDYVRFWQKGVLREK